MFNITSTNQPRTSHATLIERRKGRRRNLHQPCQATLMGNGRHDDWQCSGLMLNASPGGFACRISNADANRLTAGRIVRAVFRLEAAHEPFDFHARITNATQAGTPGFTIIGMEFLIDADRKLESKRLKDTLAAANGEVE
jgi:hypothetical protein